MRLAGIYSSLKASFSDLNTKCLITRTLLPVWNLLSCPINGPRPAALVETLSLKETFVAKFYFLNIKRCPFLYPTYVSTDLTNSPETRTSVSHNNYARKNTMKSMTRKSKYSFSFAPATGTLLTAHVTSWGGFTRLPPFKIVFFKLFNATTTKKQVKKSQPMPYDESILAELAPVAAVTSSAGVLKAFILKSTMELIFSKARMRYTVVSAGRSWI